MIASIRAPEYESEAAAGIDNASEDIPGMAQTDDIFPSPGWGDPIGLPNPDAMDAPNTHERHSDAEPAAKRAKQDKANGHHCPGGQQPRWIEMYPGRAGTKIRKSTTKFDGYRTHEEEISESKWGPFASGADWEFGKWIIESGASHSSIDKLLELPMVSSEYANPTKKSSLSLALLKVQRSPCRPSFHNVRSLLQLIDDLPKGPVWSCEIMTVQGDEIGDDGKAHVEHLELWKRNPVDCIKELIGNPTFKENIKYKPYRVYEDSEGKNRCWDEMATGNWWWDLQVDVHHYIEEY